MNLSGLSRLTPYTVQHRVGQNKDSLSKPAPADPTKVEAGAKTLGRQLLRLKLAEVALNATPGSQVEQGLSHFLEKTQSSE